MKPKFKIGDWVITNKVHNKEGRILFGRNLIQIKKPVRVKDVFVNDCDNPIHYILENDISINEIFLSKVV